MAKDQEAVNLFEITHNRVNSAEALIKEARDMAKRLIDEAGVYVGKIVAADFTGGNIV